MDGRTIAVRVAMGIAIALGLWTAFAPRGWELGVFASVLAMPGLLLFTRAMRRRVGDDPVPAGPERAEGAQTPYAAPRSPLEEIEDPAVGLVVSSACLAAGLLARVLAEASLVTWLPLAGAGLAIGALSAAAALKAGAVDRALLGPLAVCLVPWGVGVAAWLDVGFDANPPRRVPAAVMQRDRSPFETIGWHQLALGVAATERDWTLVATPARDRQHLFVGGTACLEEHDGLLGVAWAVAHACPADAALTPEEAAHRWLGHRERPAVQWPAVLQQLAAGDWRGVDAQLNALQRRLEDGEVADTEVEHAFAPFRHTGPAFDAPIAAWLAGAPTSYAAHLAAGLHARHQVDRLREAGFDEDTSPAFNAETQRAEAARQAEASVDLTTRPSLSIRLRYGVTPGQRRDLEDWLADAVAANPDDLLMRRQYLLWYPLCPCRGTVPDDPAMRRATAGGVSPRVRQALEALRLYERAVDLKGNDESMRLYAQVLDMPGAYLDETYASGINLGLALEAHGQPDAALARLDAVVAQGPQGFHGYEARGWLHERRHEYAQAAADLLADARHGDSSAQKTLGELLAAGAPGVPRDPAGAARWLAEASYNGVRGVRERLRGMPEEMAALRAKVVWRLDE